MPINFDPFGGNPFCRHLAKPQTFVFWSQLLLVKNTHKLIKKKKSRKWRWNLVSFFSNVGVRFQLFFYTQLEVFLLYDFYKLTVVYPFFFIYIFFSAEAGQTPLRRLSFNLYAVFCYTEIVLQYRIFTEVLFFFFTLMQGYTQISEETNTKFSSGSNLSLKLCMTKKQCKKKVYFCFCFHFFLFPYLFIL